MGKDKEQGGALREWADRVTAMLLGRNRKKPREETEEERLLRVAREIGDEDKKE
jgi:hypothetical protein